MLSTLYALSTAIKDIYVKLIIDKVNNKNAEIDSGLFIGRTIYKIEA